MLSLDTDLAVLDHRSNFAALAFAWPTMKADDDAFGTRLQAALERQAWNGPGVGRPINAVWSTSPGAKSLVLNVPAASVAAWCEIVGEYWGRNEQRSHRPVFTVVGSREALAGAADLRTDWAWKSEPGPAAPSSMRQVRQQGFERTLITGPDPSMRVGHGPVFLALVALMAGIGTDLQSALRAAGSNAVVSLSRTLVDGSPEVAWTVVSPAEEGLASLQLILSLTEQVVARAVAHSEALVTFARANLARAWLSPNTLARSIAEYEVMGWGGQLIRDPDSAVVDAGPLIREAIIEVVRPIGEVLGQPLT